MAQQKNILKKTEIAFIICKLIEHYCRCCHYVLFYFFYFFLFNNFTLPFSLFIAPTGECESAGVASAASKEERRVEIKRLFLYFMSLSLKVIM